MSIPSAGEYPVDLNVPPDGIADTANYPYQFLRSVYPGLDDAIQSAFQSHHVLWVITVEECPSDPSIYARIQLRRGSAYDSLQDAVTIDPSANAIGAVGSRVGDEFSVRSGLGQVPTAVASDVDAAMSETGWFEAYNLAIDATLGAAGGKDQLDGYVALATRNRDTDDIVSAAMARTLNAARAADPQCSFSTPCTMSAMHTFFDAFDMDRDSVFTASEIKASGNLRFFNIEAVLDLLAQRDGAVVYWPNHDHQADVQGSSFHFVAHEVTSAQ